MDWAKTTPRRDEKHLRFGSWCAVYYRLDGYVVIDRYIMSCYCTDDWKEGKGLLLPLLRRWIIEMIAEHCIKCKLHTKMMLEDATRSLFCCKLFLLYIDTIILNTVALCNINRIHLYQSLINNHVKIWYFCCHFRLGDHLFLHDLGIPVWLDITK